MDAQNQENIDALRMLLVSEHGTEKSSDDSKVVDIDHHVDGCPDLAPELFESLRALEREKGLPERRAYVDEHRGHYIDWVVAIVHKLGFSKETLYYTIRYFDTCLQGNGAENRRTDLISLACLILASKYEENRSPGNPKIPFYAKIYHFSCEEIIEMERSVLGFLGYDLSVVTTWSFMERYIRAAQGGSELTCMASYVAELSLYSYNMNCYLPSMVAASSVFLAKCILHPRKMPWTPTLQHYTCYSPSDLKDCVLELLDIATGRAHKFSGIRDKYSRLAHQCVALRVFPLSIPADFFKGI